MNSLQSEGKGKINKLFIMNSLPSSNIDIIPLGSNPAKCLATLSTVIPLFALRLIYSQIFLPQNMPEREGADYDCSKIGSFSSLTKWMSLNK